MTVIVRKGIQLRGQEKCLVVVFYAAVGKETLSHCAVMDASSHDYSTVHSLII